MQKFIVSGVLPEDPVRKDNVVHFKVPTKTKWMDKGTGQRQEQTEWHRFTCFGKTADFMAEYMKKGQALTVEATLHYTNWVDKQTGEKRYGQELRVLTVHPFGSNPNRKPSGDEQDDAGQPHQGQPEASSFADESFDY